MKPVTIHFLLGLLSMCVFLNATSAKWRSLFNGKDLTGWDTYLGPRYDKTKDEFAGEPIGLNSDPDNVFSVVKIDGRSAIRVSGQHFGGISTKEEFENYHLQLQFKWGEHRWAPRDSSKRDSGLLYHGVGPHGKGWFFWLRSHELQIQEGDCGDYWGVAGGTVTSPATMHKENEYVFDTSGQPMIFGSAKERVNARLIKARDGEKASGEWNIIDLYCYADTSVHVVNGKVTMVLYELSQVDGDEMKPLTKGKIQLQTEGAEVYYRDIRIEPIERIPAELLK